MRERVRMAKASRKQSILQVDRETRQRRSDTLAVEEPLEIRLELQRGSQLEEIPLAITMRTPGTDRELAAGFLFTEGIIGEAADLAHLGPASSGAGCNTLVARLRPGLDIDELLLRRHFYTTSSCGVCGKASLEALRTTGYTAPPRGLPRITPRLVCQLPARMAAAQSVFAATGGLHAAALFDADGQLLGLHEDVGRHNALDKLIGQELLAERLPLNDRILLVSGRTSFEILQKALAAGIPVVAAVSAPSTLAAELARSFGITLLGFVRGRRFNVYSDASRLSDGSRLKSKG